jgi:hypothetical protein
MRSFTPLYCFLGLLALIMPSFDEKWNIGKIFQLAQFLDICEAERGP